MGCPQRAARYASARSPCLWQRCAAENREQRVTRCSLLVSLCGDTVGMGTVGPLPCPYHGMWPDTGGIGGANREEPPPLPANDTTERGATIPWQHDSTAQWHSSPAPAAASGRPARVR